MVGEYFYFKIFDSTRTDEQDYDAYAEAVEELERYKAGGLKGWRVVSDEEDLSKRGPRRLVALETETTLEKRRDHNRELRDRNRQALSAMCAAGC